jgi:hypothetical protein
MKIAAVIVAEHDVRPQQQQHKDDVHLEHLCLIQLPHHGSFAVSAVAVSECGEWSSPRFIVRNAVQSVHTGTFSSPSM